MSCDCSRLRGSNLKTAGACSQRAQYLRHLLKYRGRVPLVAEDAAHEVDDGLAYRVAVGVVTAWRASLGTLIGRDWMAGVVDLLAMIVSKRRSSSWHLVRMPFLGCVLVVASCSAHIASETAPALLMRSASIRTGGCRSDLRRQRGCHQCGRPQRQIRHQGRRPTKARI